MKQRLRDLESRELWIAARVNELMDHDEEWFDGVADDWYEDACACGSLDEFAKNKATEQATREHASLMADLEEAIIDGMELKL